MNKKNTILVISIIVSVGFILIAMGGTKKDDGSKNIDNANAVQPVNTDFRG